MFKSWTRLFVFSFKLRSSTNVWLSFSFYHRALWEALIKVKDSMRHFFSFTRILIKDCFPLSIIRYGSRVSGTIQGKGVVPSPIPRCSSYWKMTLRVTLNYTHQLLWTSQKPTRDPWTLYQDLWKEISILNHLQNVFQIKYFSIHARSVFRRVQNNRDALVERHTD